MNRLNDQIVQTHKATIQVFGFFLAVTIKVHYSLLLINEGLIIYKFLEKSYDNVLYV